jgi:hypothetical protein
MYGVNERAFSIYDALPELIYWISDTDHDNVLRTELFFSACTQSTAKRASDIMYNCLASFICQKRTHWIDHYAAEEVMRHFQANACLRNRFPYAYAVLLDTLNGWDPFHLISHPVLSRLPYEVRIKASRELETRKMKDFMPHFFLYELIFETRFLPVYVKRMLARGIFCLENRHPRLFSLPPVPMDHNRSTLAAIMACAKRIEDKELEKEIQAGDLEDDEEDDDNDDDEEGNEDDDDDELIDEEELPVNDDDDDDDADDEPAGRKRGRPKKRYTAPRQGERRRKMDRNRPSVSRKATERKTMEVHRSLMDMYETVLVQPGNPEVCGYAPFSDDSLLIGNLRGMAVLMDFFDFIRNDAKHLKLRASKTECGRR